MNKATRRRRWAMWQSGPGATSTRRHCSSLLGSGSGPAKDTVERARSIKCCTPEIRVRRVLHTPRPLHRDRRKARQPVAACDKRTTSRRLPRGESEHSLGGERTPRPRSIHITDASAGHSPRALANPSELKAIGTRKKAEHLFRDVECRCSRTASTHDQAGSHPIPVRYQAAASVRRRPQGQDRQVQVDEVP